jgi:hypothetical protein
MAREELSQAERWYEVLEVIFFHHFLLQMIKMWCILIYIKSIEQSDHSLKIVQRIIYNIRLNNEITNIKENVIDNNKKKIR